MFPGNQYHGCRQCRRHRSLSLPLCLWAIGQLGVHRCHCLHYLCSFLVKKTFCPHLSTSPIISSTSWSVSLIFPLPVMISLNSSVLSVPEPSLSKTCNATLDLESLAFLQTLNASLRSFSRSSGFPNLQPTASVNLDNSMSTLHQLRP